MSLGKTLSLYSLLFGVLLYSSAIGALEHGNNPALSFGLANIFFGLGLLGFVDFGNRK